MAAPLGLGRRRAPAPPRPPRLLRLLAVLGRAVPIAVLASCGPERPERRGDPSLDAEIRVSPTPALVGESRVFVVATDDGAPLEQGTVRLRAEPVDRAEGREVDAGTPVPASDPRAGDAGRLRTLSPADAPGGFGPVVLRFPAAGRWRLVVEVESADGRRATIRVPLAVVGSPGG